VATGIHRIELVGGEKGGYSPNNQQQRMTMFIIRHSSGCHVAVDVAPVCRSFPASLGLLHCAWVVTWPSRLVLAVSRRAVVVGGWWVTIVGRRSFGR
jgi:hypothetical protein